METIFFRTISVLYYNNIMQKQFWHNFNNGYLPTKYNFQYSIYHSNIKEKYAFIHSSKMYTRCENTNMRPILYNLSRKMVSEFIAKIIFTCCPLNYHLSRLRHRFIQLLNRSQVTTLIKKMPL